MKNKRGISFHFQDHQDRREEEIHFSLCILSPLIVIETDVRQTLPAVAGGTRYANSGGLGDSGTGSWPGTTMARYP